MSSLVLQLIRSVCEGIDAVLCKVHLVSFSSSKSGVHVPLLRSCPLGYKFVFYPGTIASPAWFSFCVVPSQLGSIDPHGVPQYSVRP